MAQIEPLKRDELPELEGLFGAYEQIMGLVPTTVLTMARMPGLVEAYAGLALPAAMNGLIGEDLAQMCANVTSAAAGCRYCQAHTIAHAEHLGVPATKLDELWSWETSDHFTDAERAALTIAYHAGMHPNAVTDDDVARAREHFTDDQLTAIVAVCSLFGFLNRWNDTVATQLEAPAWVAATDHLRPQGWHVGRHEGPDAPAAPALDAVARPPASEAAGSASGPRIAPLDPAELADRAEGFALIEAYMGFVPTSLFTMARVPGLLDGFGTLARTVFLSPLLPDDLVQMCANVTSAAAGCRYCQAHTIAHAEHLGVPATKLDELWSWETSDHFTDAERTALTLAYHAGMHPNAVTDADFDRAREHWSEEQLVALVAVCAVFGFLNRWNDTMATQLEAVPLASAERHLGPRGWEPGKHAVADRSGASRPTR